MEPWVLKDGTKLWLGGKVEGEGDYAYELRERIDLARTRGITSGWLPGYEEMLDVNVPHLVDYWLRECLNFPVVSGPAVEYPREESPGDPFEHSNMI